MASGEAVNADPRGVPRTICADLADDVQIVTNFSQDKQAMTAIFRNLHAGTGNGSGSFVNTRSASLVLPIENSGTATRVTQDIRGYVSVQGKARAALIVQAAGKTTVIDLKKAKLDPASAATAEALSKKPKPRPQLLAGVRSDPSKTTDGEDFDFQQRIDGTIPVGAKYQVTFFLLVEADTDASGAALFVDSLDVEIRKPDYKSNASR